MTASRVDAAGVEALTASHPAARLDAAGVEVLASGTSRRLLGGVNVEVLARRSTSALGGIAAEVLAKRTVAARVGGIAAEVLAKRAVAARLGGLVVEVASKLPAPTLTRLAAAAVEVASSGGVYRGTASRSAGAYAEVLTESGLPPVDGWQAPAPPNPNVGPWTLPW